MIPSIDIYMSGFIDRFFRTRLRTLSWLITVNVAISLMLWIFLIIDLIFSCNISDVINYLGLPASVTRLAWVPWTPVTYMFTQLDFFQLLFNMLWLAWFGHILLDTDSPATLLKLYLGGGLAGALCYLITVVALPGSGTILLGSSSAILSVMLFATIRQPDRHVPLLAIGAVRLKWIAIATIILTLVGGSGPAAHLAHIGGIIFPIILIGLRKSRVRKQDIPHMKKRRSPFGKKVPDHQPVPPEDVVDRLLDKIRISGYDSLSEAEKGLLSRASEHMRQSQD